MERPAAEAVDRKAQPVVGEFPHQTIARLRLTFTQGLAEDYTFGVGAPDRVEWCLPVLALNVVTP